MTPKFYAIVPAAQLADPAAGAAVALAVGQLAAACRDHGVGWALWLRDHHQTAAQWAKIVHKLAWVAQLGGEIGISAPADGPAGWAACQLSALGVARVHVHSAAQPAWVGVAHPPMVWACHDPAAVAATLQAGAAAVMLSPVWPTASKQAQLALGVAVLRAACQDHSGRVIALGGIDRQTAALAAAAGATGIASLGGWRSDAKQLVAAWAGTASVPQGGSDIATKINDLQTALPQLLTQKRGA